MTTTVTTSTTKLTVADLGEVEVTVEDRGQGQPFLLLHGGAGPQSFSGFAGLLAGRENARVLTPIHPGFAGTPRPDGLGGIAGLAVVYRDLLDALGLEDVTVIGNSMGGWIAAELALLHSPRVSGIVLVDAVGIEVEGHPVADVSGLTPNEIMALSYHDPAPFRIDPSTLTEGQLAAIAANRAALQVYGGATMTDPTLLDRLRGITVPTLVLSGESDRIVDPEYGRAFAAAIHWARFVALPATGHMPQIETPDLLLRTIQNAGDAPGGTYSA
jgi:pimeloyl-ACP methyl ester carboxylesterase